MLEGITWIHFIAYLGGALVLYYLVLMVMYGKAGGAKGQRARGAPPISSPPVKKVWHLEEVPLAEAPPPQATGAPEVKQDQEQVDEQTPEMDEPEEALETDQEEKLMQRLELLTDQVQETISGAGRHTDKGALLSRLGKIISRYPDLHHPAFRRAITGLIIQQAKLECDLEIIRDETDALWFSL